MRQLQDGRARVAGLAVEGAPGIGKTTLWRAALGDARGLGFRVIASTPAEPDQALAFTGLGDLFDGLPEGALAGLPEPQRRALDAALFLESPARAPADAQALPRAALTLLRALAVDGPLLLAIDDEQWLDAPSARVLGFALCRLHEEPICVLVARRPGSQGALWPQLERGFGAQGMESLSLPPLGVDTIHRLLSHRLGVTFSAPLVRRIHAVSGGNPFYALAIARAVQASNGAATGAGELPIPPTLAETVVLRLEGLDTRSADALLVVAAVSNPTLGLLRSVFADFTLSVLDGPVDAGVIDVAGDRVRFTHPLLASAHYSRASVRRRRELHGLLAEVVQDEEERAHHLARSAEAPDRRVAVLIEQAAARATRRGAPEAAAELLEQAARLTPQDAPEARHSRTIAAAGQHRAAGDRARARSLLEALLEDLPRGPVRARALLLEATLREDDFDVALELSEEALANAQGHDRVGAEIEAYLAEICNVREDLAAALEHSRAAIERAERAGDPHVLARALAEYGVDAFFSGLGVQEQALTRAIELAEDDHETPSIVWPSSALGLQLLLSDQLAAARPLLQRSLRRTTERGEEEGRQTILFYLARVEWQAGHREAAERLTAQTMQAHRQIGNSEDDSGILFLEAFVAARHGDLDQARTRAGQAIDLAGRIGHNLLASCSTAILAAVELWTGHPAAAHEHLPPLQKAYSESFLGSLTIPFWSCDIEALIALGRLKEAGEVLDDLFGRAERAANPNALAIAYRCRGLLLAGLGRQDEAIEALDAALREHDRRPLPLEIGYTLLEKGTLERRAKRKRAAKHTLEQALATLEPLHASLWIARARDELGRIGLRRAAASDGLTPAQLRVAELVASGMSNREVAATLYMSLRTVETHLTKVYRELGVRSR
jgi:DNA-binding CsgD family transcriptional regulator